MNQVGKNELKSINLGLNLLKIFLYTIICLNPKSPRLLVNSSSRTT